VRSRGTRRNRWEGTRGNRGGEVRPEGRIGKREEQREERECVRIEGSEGIVEEQREKKELVRTERREGIGEEQREDKE
jgi:hypothetical protein